jgi:hypothetical protein
LLTRSFPVDDGHVSLHGVFAYANDAGDGFVRFAVGEEPQDVHLARGQFVLGKSSVST